jgi:hypothetical protein
MSDVTAGRARERLVAEGKQGALPTTLAVYSRHVTDVLGRADAQLGAEAGSYGSILDALAKADPALGQLRRDYDIEQALAAELRDAEAEEHKAREKGSYRGVVRADRQVRRARERLQEYQKQLKARALPVPAPTAEARQVIKDTLVVASVALRLAQEAAATASLLAFELTRLASLPPYEHAAHAAEAAQLISQGPALVRSIRADLEVDLLALEQLAETLARFEATDLELAPGFAYREGLVDEVVGFTLDLLHFKADAGGEAYFFNPFALEVDRDYTGRTNELRYRIDPILLASARLSASFDLSRLPAAGGLKLGYATDRVYASGGSIENRSLAAELGATGRFSDVLDAALLISGWQATVRLAHFTSGTVDVVQVTDGTVAASAPFALTFKEVMFSRELAGYTSQNAKSVVLKVGYFDYTLPRIMYEFDDATPDADSSTWVLSRESPVQRVRTQLVTWGGIGMFEFPVLRRLDVLFGASLSWGFGREQFYIEDAEGNREDHDPFTVAISALGHLGVRWRFVGLGSRFHADFDALYQAQYLNSSLGTTFGLDGRIPIGSQSLFHGPHARLSASF